MTTVIENNFILLLTKIIFIQGNHSEQNLAAQGP